MFKIGMIVWAVILGIFALKVSGAEVGSSVIRLTFLAAYFLPIVIALGRQHRNALAIFMLNLFLGWTGLGWIFALVWSCTNNHT
jgi:hypothetical protein